MRENYKAPVVKKAFQILEHVVSAAQGPTISDLSRELKISKSTVHGIIGALEEAGAVVREDGTKRYLPGLTLFELGRATYSRIDLKLVARPLMEELRARTGESVFIGTRHDDHVSILDIVESTRDLKITSPVGTRLPLLAGATGKVFLAQLAPAQAASLVRALGLRPYTRNTITDPARYLAGLEAVRREGYATDDEEYISGVRAVAAPILGGRAQSAIWVVGFTPSLDAEKLVAVARETKAVAGAIGRSLNPYPA